MNHLWQRFLLASSLIVGLFIGVATTVFGYSNLTTVDVHWSILHINGVPLWTVAVVPLVLFVVAGTLYHWMNGLHHFTEHMRHRRRVHELEAELASLRAHLDQVLEMPDHSTSKLPDRMVTTASLPAAGNGITDFAPAEAEPMPAEPPTQAPAYHESPATPAPLALTARKARSARRKRVMLEVAGATDKPDKSESNVGQPPRDDKPAEPGDRLEQEA